MTYNVRPYATNDTLSASKNQIRNNFSLIRDRFQDNHTDIDSGEGKHKYMQMPEQTSAPTTDANEGALYTKESTINNVTDLFYRRESDGSELQITGLGGLLPTVQQGTVAISSDTSWKNLFLLEQNVYGIVWLYESSTPTIQIGHFFSDSTTAYGFSSREKKVGSSDDYYVELRNTSVSGLSLQGRARSSDYYKTYNIRVFYWRT